MAESEALGMPYAAGRGDMRSESPCVRSGHRVRRALVGLLGVAFTLWFTNSLFHCETSPTGFVYFRDVRVSDGVVSFNPEWTMTIGYVSDYSWRVEGDRLYLTYYGSYLSSYLPMSVLDRTNVRTGRRINWIILVCEEGEFLWWEADPSAPGRPDLPKAY